MPRLGEIVELLHGWFPPETAEPWDAVGLVAGDPDAPVRRVLFAVDPVPEVAREAVQWGADLLVVHHPLFLRPVHGFPATTPKGRTLATLVGADCALLTAHTNADHAAGGVSEALARAVGLRDLAPVRPARAPALDKLVVHVPEDDAAAVRAALADAGAGRIGAYDRCSYTSVGEGRFRPLAGARPAVGTVGAEEIVRESRVEVVLPRRIRSAVVSALLAAHPYEEPAYDLVELADPGLAATGTGRIGTVDPPDQRAATGMTLGAFADRVAAALPRTAPGVRVAGDPDRPVRRVAVCGGSGDFLLDEPALRAVDVFVTSDLRHHPASEFLSTGDVARGPALVDVAHWAGEWPWLPVVARRLIEALGAVAGEEAGAAGDTVETRVSTLVTDPWSSRR